MQCLVSILSFSHILSQHRRAVSLSRLFNFKRGGMKPGGTIRYQYSIYAGRHVVPGLEGLLLECTADVIRMWSPLSVPRWSSTA